MKRRNADCGKLRRPMKRSKIAEGMYGSATILYMKFLIVWGIVIIADFAFMFRFEFLWPFWLLLRSVHDSFKYKGLAFSVLFICTAITSDLVCLFFIPVHWLLFAASTYVWVQYVWHTDKGICLPTIILWMLFVYLEAGIRWKDSRYMPHVDLCRPFAAHCIGYPVVTLGFGFKSYLSYRIRQRRQKEVSRENEFFMQILQQAVPKYDPNAVVEDPAATSSSTSTTTTPTTTLSTPITTLATSLSQFPIFDGTNVTFTTDSAINGMIVTSVIQTIPSLQHANINISQHGHNLTTFATDVGGITSLPSISYCEDKIFPQTVTANGGGGAPSNGHIGINPKTQRRSSEKENKIKVCSNAIGDNEYKVISKPVSINQSFNDSKNLNSSAKVFENEKDEQKPVSNTKKLNSSSTSNNCSISQNEDDEPVVEPIEKNKSRRNRSKKENILRDQNNYFCNINSNHIHKDNSSQNHTSDVTSTSSNPSVSFISSSTTSTISNLASKVVAKICESCLKLEADVKKYRAEISQMKQIENELRQKLETNLTTKSCLLAKQKECDDLEKRLHEVNNARHADNAQLQTVERRLLEERRQKQSLDAQLNNEKKARKLADEKASRAECSTQCKQRKQQMDEEIKQLKRDLKVAEEAKLLAEQQGRKWEQELKMFEAEVRSRDSNQADTEMLMNALAAIQDKNCTLEKNLSAETRVKLDLFSALGDAKRQLEIAESRRRSKDEEVIDLKAKIAQLLAVMPPESLCLPACSSTGASSMLRMNDTPPMQAGPGPASPMLSSLNSQNSVPGVNHQINSRVNQNSAADYVQQSPSEYINNQQSQQQHCTGVPPMSKTVLVSGPSMVGVGTPGGSNLDPNASIYTPKTGQMGKPPSGNVSGGVSVNGDV